MERTGNVIILVFAEGHTISGLLKKRTPKQLLRLLRKHPRIVYMHFGSFLSWLVTGSSHRHVLPSDGTVAIDFTWTEIRYRPHSGLARAMPGITGWVMLESDGDPVDMEKYTAKKRGVISTTIKGLFMWATFGIYQVENCTSLARNIMLDMGIPVSRWAWSPRHLLQWCTQNGYDFYAGDPPSSGGTVDPGA